MRPLEGRRKGIRERSNGCLWVVAEANLTPMDLPPTIRSRLLNELPLPVAQLLRRGLNAKSAVDRHHLFYFAGEAALKLAAAARVGVWLDNCLEPGSSGARRLEALVLPSVGHWLSLLRDLSADLAHRPETRLLPLANVDSELRRSRPHWKGVERLVEVATGAGSLADEVATRARGGGIIGFFELLVAYRNEVMAHGAHRGVGFYSEMADALGDALVEVLADPAWLGGFELAVARLGPEEEGSSRIAWQVLQGLGGLLRRPQADAQDMARDAICRPGELYLLSPGVRVPLHPLLVFREDDLGREQIGFLNRTVRREGAAGLEVRRVDFLDYVSGERLQGVDARAEVQRLFSRLRGEEVADPALDASLALEDGAATDRAAEAATPAVAVLGDFELEGELGRGGMGVVYRARQRSLNRRVALKVLPPDLAADPVTLARFRREISALARCDHPNVVRILATGLDGDRWWYAMELVDGVDLAAVFEVLSSWQGRGAHLTAGHLLAAVSSSTGLRASRSVAPAEGRAGALPEVPKLEPPPAPHLGEGGEDFDRRLAELMAGACRGVEHLHELGIVHRDLKPGNLMLTADGSRMVVTDLGLAQLREASLQLTRTAAGLLGTLRYMAPEQLHGRLLEIDHRADIYGLGATLYELACLRPVYEGATEQELLRRKVEEEPTAPRKVRPDLPEDLATILETALRRRPTERYATAAALAEDLTAFAENRPIRARPARRLYYLRLFAERNRSLVRAILLSSTVLVVLGTTLTVWALKERASYKRAAREVEYEQVIAATRSDSSSQGLANPLLLARRAARALTSGEDPDVRGRFALALQALPRTFWRDGPVSRRPVLSASRRFLFAKLKGDSQEVLWDISLGKRLSVAASRNVENADNEAVAIDDAGTALLEQEGDAYRLRELATGVVHPLPAGTKMPKFQERGRRLVGVKPHGTGWRLQAWDSVSGAETASVALPDGEPGNVIVSQGSSMVAVALDRERFELVDLSGDLAPRELLSPCGMWCWPALDSSGERLAHQSPIGVRVWSLRDGKPPQETALPGDMYQLSFSPDGRYVLALGLDGSWLLDSWIAGSRTRLPCEDNCSGFFDPTSTFLALAGDVEGSTVLEVDDLRLRAEFVSIQAIAFLNRSESSDAAVVARSAAGDLVAITLPDRSLWRSPPSPSSSPLFFSEEDCSLLATTKYPVQDLQTWRPEELVFSGLRLPGALEGVFVPQQRRHLSIDGGGRVLARSLDTGTVETIATLPVAFQKASGAASPDGNTIALLQEWSGLLGLLRFEGGRWDARSINFPLPQRGRDSFWGLPEVFISGDGRSVLIGSGDPSGEGKVFWIAVLDSRTGREVWRAESMNGEAFGFTSDSRGVIAPDRDGRVVIRDSRDGRVLHNLNSSGGFESARTSPDGRWLSGARLDEIEFFALGAAEGISATVPFGVVFRDRPGDVCWSPDGKWFFVAGRSGLYRFAWPLLEEALSQPAAGVLARVEEERELLGLDREPG